MSIYIIPYLFIISMKDMRSIGMYHYISAAVPFTITVTGYVISRINNMDIMSIFCQFAPNNCTRETCTNNQNILFHNLT